MRRSIYHLNVTDKQMQVLQNLVKQERQRLAADKTPATPLVIALKNIQKALDNSVYFHAKHNLHN